MTPKRQPPPRRRQSRFGDRFSAGYYCAVATLLEMYADDVAATQLIHCLGKPSKADKIDPLDWEVLEKFGLVETNGKAPISP
jgi:hypothetical protein